MVLAVEEVAALIHFCPVKVDDRGATAAGVDWTDEADVPVHCSRLCGTDDNPWCNRSNAAVRLVLLKVGRDTERSDCGVDTFLRGDDGDEAVRVVVAAAID